MINIKTLYLCIAKGIPFTYVKAMHIIKENKKVWK